MAVKVNLSYRLLGASPLLPVQHLREMIEQELGIPIQRQILTSCGRLLYGPIPFAQTSENQFFSHVNITIRPPTEMVLSINPDYTILQIKNRLHQTFRGIPPNMFMIIDFPGHELLDLVTLDAYGVEHLSCIYAIVRGSEGNLEYLGRVRVRYSMNDPFISPAAIAVAYPESVLRIYIVLEGQPLAVHAVVAPSEKVEILEDIWLKYNDNEYPLEGFSYTFGPIQLQEERTFQSYVIDDWDVIYVSPKSN